MKTQVDVRLPKCEDWIPGTLTDERGFGHPVVIVEGESVTRSPAEVFLLRAVAGATDEVLLEEARHAGYVIAHEHQGPVGGT